MKILGIIPARYASSRFPGKPLEDIAGKSMIRRVFEQASKSESLNRVIVATDDERIINHVTEFGGEAMMTSANHQSGTDRCAEVARHLPGYDVVINIQGDEPFIDPRQIDLLVDCFYHSDNQLATLVKKINTLDELNNANIPKVVISKDMQALYFSRTIIPSLRGYNLTDWLNHHTYYKHIGIYGYRADALQEITNLPVSALEKAEALEQLRWIENGYRIQVAITELETLAVDTPQDIEKVLNHMKP